MRHLGRRNCLAAVTVFAALLSCSSRQPGQRIDPGFNLYSQQDDIQLGREAAAEVRKQVDVVDDQRLQKYVSEIGNKLAREPAAGQYPYSFTLINDDSINAFALPGGPIFVHSGLLEAADNEAQLAGVLAHEIAHVVLRHGTSQASKANLVQLPAVLAGTAIGDHGALAQLGQVGLGLGVNALMLKYSRSAEKEADARGARLMAQAGYNPMEMADFFEKLEAQGGSRSPSFLSSHPNPGHRMELVQAEVQALPQSGPYRTNTGRFPRMRKLAAQLPPPNPPQQTAQTASAPQPSVSGFSTLNADTYSIAYPKQWRAYGNKSTPSVTIAPDGGLVRGSSGGVSVGFGAVLSYYQPNSSGASLSSATSALLDQFRQSNSRFQVAGRQQRVTVDGSAGLLTPLSSQSPYGGTETDTLLTVARPEGLFYVVFVAPSGQYQQVQSAYQRMIDSLTFPG